MDLVDRVRNNVYDTFADLDSTKALRLVIIVGGYILIRNLISRELIKRKLQAEVRKDEREMSDNKGKGLIDEPETEADSSTTEFGWGNKTRNRVKKQEEVFAKMVERAQAQRDQIDDDDLADIQEFLHD